MGLLRRVSGVLLPALLLGALQVAPLPAAPTYRTWFPATEFRGVQLPELRLLAEAPFEPSREMCGAVLERRGEESPRPSAFWGSDTLAPPEEGLRVRARSLSARSLEVSVLRGRFPTSEEIRDGLRMGLRFPLTFEPLGEAIWTKRLEARPDLVRRWRAGVRPPKRPEKLFPEHYFDPEIDRAVRDLWSDPRQLENLAWNIRSDLIPDLLERDGEEHHQVKPAREFFLEKEEALSPGFGDEMSGYRDHPWVALEPQYSIQLESPVPSLPPGTYLVEARSSRIRTVTPYLHSDLQARTWLGSGELEIQAYWRSKGEPAGGVEGMAYGLYPLSTGEERVPEGSPQFRLGAWQLDFDREGFSRLEVPEGVGAIWLVLEHGLHRRLLLVHEEDSREANPTWVHLATDRPLYRPGETIHVRGVLRDRASGIELPVPSGRDLDLKVGKRWQEGGELVGEVRTNSLGVFEGAVEIPPDWEDGGLDLKLESAKGEPRGERWVRVESYRKPRHELRVEALEPWTLQGEETRFRVRGRYLVGGPLAGARLRWKTRSAPRWQSSHWRHLVTRDWQGNDSGTRGGTGEGEAVLDEAGEVLLTVPIPSGEQDCATRLEVTVLPPDGSEIQEVETIYTPRADRFLALRSSKEDPDRSWQVEVWIRDLTGRERPGTLDLRLERMVEEEDELVFLESWEVSAGDSQPTTPIEEFSRIWQVSVPASGRATCTVDLPGPGFYRLRAEVEDDAGRRAETTLTRLWEDRPADQEPSLQRRSGSGIQVDLDQQEFSPGDRPSIRIQSSLEAGLVWWRLEGSRGVSSGRFACEGGESELVLPPLGREHQPEAHLNLWWVEDGVRSGENLTLEVPAREKQARLAVETESRVYVPGAPVTVTLTFSDPQGAPLEGDVGLAIFDEALSLLADDPSPDLYETFFGERSWRWSSRTLPVSWQLPIFSESLAGGSQARVVGGGIVLKMGHQAQVVELEANYSLRRGSGFGDAFEELGHSNPFTTSQGWIDGGPEPAVRDDFRDLAHWVGSTRTDASGRAVVRFELPDDLARWKILAWAVDGETRVAEAEGRIVTRRELMVRLGLPRHLVQGDHLLVPASVQNLRPDDVSGELRFVTPGLRPVPLGETDLQTLGVEPDPGIGWLRSPTGPVRRAPDRYQLEVSAGTPRAVSFPVYAFDYPASYLPQEPPGGGRTAKQAEMLFEGTFRAQEGGDAVLRRIPVRPLGVPRVEVSHQVFEGGLVLDLSSGPEFVAEAESLEIEVQTSLAQRMASLLAADLRALEEDRDPDVVTAAAALVSWTLAEEYLGRDRLRGLGLEEDPREIRARCLERLREARADEGWGWGSGAEASPLLTARVLHQLRELPGEEDSRLLRRLDVSESVRWLGELLAEKASGVLAPPEGTPREENLLELLEVWAAVAAWEEDRDSLHGLPVPPEIPGGLEDALRGDPRLLSRRAWVARHRGKADELREGLQRLRDAVEQDGTRARWALPGETWEGEENRAGAEILALLVAEENELDGSGDLVRGGLRWLLLKEREATWASTRLRSARARLLLRFLGTDSAEELQRPEEAEGASAARTLEVRVGSEVRSLRLPSSPLSPGGRLLLQAPELAPGRGRVELWSEGATPLEVRTTRRRLLRGFPEAPGGDWPLSSEVETASVPHPAHEPMTRVVTFELGSSRRFLQLEVPVVAGGELRRSGALRPSLARLDEEGKWQDLWVPLDFRDDGVVFLPTRLRAGRYRARVPFVPELPGFLTMPPAQLSQPLLRAKQGTSRAHRLRIRTLD